jgi:hypothetical protein
MLDDEPKIYVNCGDVQNDIDILQENEPDGRTKEWQIWKEQINSLFLKYNGFAGEKIYKLI